jgi:trimeric autotransporter adhesin
MTASTTRLLLAQTLVLLATGGCDSGDAATPDGAVDPPGDASTDVPVHPGDAAPDAGEEGAEALLHAQPEPGGVWLSWSDVEADRYDVYRSADATCDIDEIGSCPGGAVDEDVHSPHHIEGLPNGVHQSFWLVAHHGDGETTVTTSGARPDHIGTNATIRVMTTAPGGELVLGGAFTRVGVTSGSGVPLLRRAMGTRPYPAVAGGAVDAVAPDGQGGFYIGGRFTHVGGEPREHLAHILADGTVGAFNPSVDSDGPWGVSIEALHRAGDVLYLGGTFTEIDGQPRLNLAAFDAEGALLDWAPQVEGEVPDEGYVYALTSDGNRLYVGGWFAAINGEPRAQLAVFDGTGALEDWAPEVEGWGVAVLATHGGRLYVGGWFETIDDAARPGLAAFDDETGALLDWAPDAGMDVEALAVHDGRVFVGGGFEAIDGAPRNCVAAFDETGVLEDWAPDVSVEGVIGHGTHCYVSGLAADAQGLWMGGTFGTIDGEPRHGLASFGPDGALTDWHPVLDRWATALAIHGDVIYAGGGFQSLAAEPRAHLVALDAQGRPMDLYPEPDGTVYAFEVNGNNLYVGGDFQVIGDAPRTGLAAFDAEGSLLGFAPELDGNVRALRMFDDHLYVGGGFTEVNELPRSHLASFTLRWHLTDFAPEVSSTVLAIEPRGVILYVGGGFASIGEESRPRIASFDDEGDLRDFNPGASSSVSALLQYGRTDLFVGGGFTTIDATARQRLAVFDREEGLTSFAPGITGGSVHALAGHGGLLYAGGGFHTVDGEPRPLLAAFDADGEFVEVPVLGGQNVHSVHSHGGALYVGGQLSSRDGQAASNFAVLQGP